VTRHSFVRSPDLRASTEDESEGRDTDVTMIGNEERYGSASSDTVVEVVLGVDTHLDVHVAVALDQLGRRLDTFSVPTTKKGYEDLLAWAEGFGAPLGVPGWREPAAMGP
jgi:hypothetical protein